ncbi:hypothetical protein JCM10207_005618 [Rhodosporidiobolus poonsookiae]
MWSTTRPASYDALPTSPSATPSLAYPSPSSASSRRQRARRLLLVLVGIATFLVLSSAVVPEEHLPTQVQSAVSKGREAYEAALRKAGSTPWRWDDAHSPVQENDGLGGDRDAGAPLSEVVNDEPKQVAVEQKEEEEKPNSAAVISQDELEAAREDEQDAAETWQPVMDEVEEEVAVICSSELKAALGKASFWAVTETAPRTYRIAARDPLDAETSAICLSQAVFTARLVSVPPPSASKTDDLQASQTLIALDAPTLADDLSSYDLAIPSDLVAPQGSYTLDVRLDFGLYVGVLEGAVCGPEARSCDPVKLSAQEGPELRYAGESVEVVQGKTIELGQASTQADLPRCTDLSSLDGYWSSLAYHPTSPSPCELVTPSFPMPFVPASPAARKPLWLHFIGDSNTRNMYSHLLSSLGRGGKVNAPKVRDSPTHNGTVASVGFHWREGAVPADPAQEPDVIVTWNWWYQTSPPPSASDKSFAFHIDANRADLVRLADVPLATYLAGANMRKALQPYPNLQRAARTLRPHRTFLSLGSHGEELSVAGVEASLDALLSESDGLSRAARDRANLRMFTTTLVNARYIPLARFPHQDLVRANALIHSKNAYAASRPELGGEGRVLDVERLTRGVVEEDGWMKTSRAGPDAVHFQGEVYDEWVRVVWTELMRGAGVDAVAVEGEEEEEEEKRAVGTDEARRRWKRRLAWLAAEEVEEGGEALEDEED